MNKARIIALYLPQFHPTKENDYYWGKGFTEWRNVAKARPLFKGHYQPRIPADLGFYDLRLEETRIEQAKMAEEYGIEGFCYWHYWFGNGRMILEKPLEEVLQSGKPDYPFCVGWANHTWSNKTWQKAGAFQTNVTMIEQTYPGEEDIIAHFNYMLPFFKDERYIKVDGKPLFMVFNPWEVPKNEQFIKIWRKLAAENGLQGIHFVARVETADYKDTKEEILSGENTRRRFNECINWGYDAIYSVTVQAIKNLNTNTLRKNVRRVQQKFNTAILPQMYNYRKIMRYMFSAEDTKENVYPQIMPHWDNTPRAGKNGYLYTGESPSLFGAVVSEALEKVKNKEPEHRIIFAHSWNEWGEGAYLEPDLRYGKDYLEEIKKRIKE